MPTAALDRAHLLRDVAQLRRTERVVCETGLLAAPTRADIDAVMAASAAHPEAWDGVAAQLRSVGIDHQGGGINPGDQRALHAIIARLRPRSILEVGTHIGASTITMAATLEVLGLEGHITTVDILDVNTETGPWREAGLSGCPRELLARAGASHRVDFRVGSSQALLDSTAADFDLIFLDGAHAAAAVYRELPLALRRLRPGGWIVLHDYFPQRRRLWKDAEIIHGPWLATERLRREGAALAVVALGELPWPTKQGNHVTSLAAVTRTGV
jgi:predicted O-methyltransferase YrrM